MACLAVLSSFSKILGGQSSLPKRYRVCRTHSLGGQKRLASMLGSRLSSLPSSVRRFIFCAPIAVGARRDRTWSRKPHSTPVTCCESHSPTNTTSWTSSLKVS
ncbi:hypothetical protein FOQG_19498 [Fusarium oxysporum f. sp. raphani 54005]|uniref:Uncharacterized protein n=1 Tax=Fusarium oxysporum f. sp. raphani 54005 TaxID=1089458 RepID=X0BAA0_FUSOX|nr:hypothetical protein FOQG_19498 [Fusarium oxysporum f. sp. raphani 54005]